MKKKIKNTPITIWIPGALMLFLCIFSLVNGIYYLWGSANIKLLDTESLEVVKPVLIKAFDMAGHPMEDFSFVAGVLTTGIGIFQGLIGVGLLLKNRVFYILAIAFYVFSLVMVVSKTLVVVTAFGLGKIVLYIVMLVLLFLPKSLSYVFKKK